MKRLIVTGALVAGLAALPGFASAETKIGVVDMQRAVSETAEGVAARASIFKKSEQLNNELKGIQSDFEKLKAELEKDGSSMKQDVRADKEQQLQQKSRDFQKRQRDAQEELKQMEADILQKLVGRLSLLIGKIGEREKIELILDQSAGVRFYSKSIDITPQLVKMADETNGK